MQPVLNPASEAGRDRVIVEKWSVLLYRYERGNVFLLRYTQLSSCHCLVQCGDCTELWPIRRVGVHRSPDNPKKLLIKRLLALEGDWITVPGEAEIRKIPQVSEVSEALYKLYRMCCGFEEAVISRKILYMIVLQGFCWVEGDNVTCSEDSRTKFGPVRSSSS